MNGREALPVHILLTRTNSIRPILAAKKRPEWGESCEQNQ